MRFCMCCPGWWPGEAEPLGVNARARLDPWGWGGLVLWPAGDIRWDGCRDHHVPWAAAGPQEESQ